MDSAPPAGELLRARSGRASRPQPRSRPHRLPGWVWISFCGQDTQALSTGQWRVFLFFLALQSFTSRSVVAPTTGRYENDSRRWRTRTPALLCMLQGRFRQKQSTPSSQRPVSFPSIPARAAISGNISTTRWKITFSFRLNRT